VQSKSFAWTSDKPQVIVPLIVEPKSENVAPTQQKEPAVGASGLFVRGDADANGVVDALDSVYILNYIDNGPVPTCMDAADVNDDGKVDSADTIYLLNYLFDKGPALPGPNFCGKDSLKPDPWPAAECVFQPCN